jgi:hypothetical protein
MSREVGKFHQEVKQSCGIERFLAKKKPLSLDILLSTGALYLVMIAPMSGM